MDKYVHPSDRAQTCVKMSFTIAPASHADDRVSELLSNLAFDIARMVGCSSATAAKANRDCIDETEGTLRENLLASGELEIDLVIIGERVLVHGAVRQPVVDTSSTDAWFPPDAPGQAIQPDEPVRDMGKDPSRTIRRKRSELAKGGLGLMRLTAESQEKVGSEPDGSGGQSGGEGGLPALAAIVVPLRKKPD